MSKELEMLNNLAYSDKIKKQLSLSELQLYALNTFCFREDLPEHVAKAIGATDAEIEEWESNPFYQVCWHIRLSGYVENFLACLDAVQAGFLASIGVAYKDIEALLELPGGEIVRWRNAADWETETDAGRKGEAFGAAERALWSMKREARLHEMSDKQRQALPLILSGKTDKEVGDAVGVCRETISDWKRNQDFKSMLDAERERLVVVNRERLGTLFEKACARASELMDSNDERVSLYATLGVLKTLKDVALPVQSVSEKKESVEAHVLFGMLNQLGALKGLPNSK